MKTWERASDNYWLNIDDNHYPSYLNRKDYTYERSFFDIDKSSQDETALIQRSPWLCLILNGDFRKEYEEVCDKGYDACLEVYNKHKDTHRSSWSED